MISPPPGGLLPKCDPLPGCVVEQYRTIGGKRHRPYHFRVWRDEDGRQRKTYVRREDVERVREACLAHSTIKKTRGQRHRRAVRRWAKEYEAFVDDVVALVDLNGCLGASGLTEEEAWHAANIVARHPERAS